MIEKKIKHGQNSEEKIGLIFVLAILLSELEFHKKNKKMNKLKKKQKKNNGKPFFSGNC